MTSLYLLKAHIVDVSRQSVLFVLQHIKMFSIKLYEIRGENMRYYSPSEQNAMCKYHVIFASPVTQLSAWVIKAKGAKFA